MTVFRRRTLALAITASCVFSFAAQRFGFTPGLRLVWLASGTLCAAAFLLYALMKDPARQVLTGLALLFVFLFASYSAASVFFSSRIEPARRLSEKEYLSVSGRVTRISEDLIVVSGDQNTAISLRGLDAAPSPEVGDLVDAAVRIDAGPDSVSDALWSQGVYLKGTALSLKVTGKTEPDLIQRLKNALTEAFAPLRTPGIARAMTFGVRGGEEETVRDALRRSGTAHLLSVSGLHVSMVLFAVVFVLGRLGAGPKLRAAGVIAAAFAYVALLGFIPSAVRAAIMTGAFCLSRALRRDYDPLTALAVCAFSISFADPGVWRSSSFLLSLSASLGIIRVSLPLTERLSSSKRFEHPNRAAAFALACARDILCGLSVTVGAVSFSLPVMMGLSRSVNALAPAANLVLGALFPAVLAPLFLHSALFVILRLAGAASLAVYGAKVCDLFLFVFEKCAVFFSDVSVPITLWQPYTKQAVFFSVCALIAAAAVLKLRPLKTALLGSSAILVCIAINIAGLLGCRGEIALVQNAYGERAIVLGAADRRVLVLDRKCELAGGFEALCEKIGADSFDAVVTLCAQDAGTLAAASRLGENTRLAIPSDLADGLSGALGAADAGYALLRDGEELELDGGIKLRLSGTRERALDLVIGGRVLCLRVGFDGAPEVFSCGFGAPDALLLVNCPSLSFPDGTASAPLVVWADNGPEGKEVFDHDGSFFAAYAFGGIFTLSD